jgi:hypothetical protein
VRAAKASILTAGRRIFVILASLASAAIFTYPATAQTPTCNILLLSCTGAIAQQAAPPETQDFTLWGVTLDQPLDHVKFPHCKQQSIDDIVNKVPDPTNCLNYRGIGSWELRGVPWPGLPALQIRIGGGFKVADPVDVVYLEIGDNYCNGVLQVLTKKFGQPTTHASSIMQNGFGAKWPGETWYWLYAKNGGKKLMLQKHVSEDDGCFLYARSEAAAAAELQAPEVPKP